MNLIYRNGEPHHFKIHQYPDGQKNVTLDMAYFNDVKQPINIHCNIRSFDELEVLLCLVAALRRHDFVVSHITFYYLMGMRSDRSFELGMPNYFRDVLAPIINNIGVRSSILCPHSKLSCAALKNSHPFPVMVNEHNCFVIRADQSAEWHDLYFQDDSPHFEKTRLPNGLIEVNLSKRYIFQLREQSPETPILVKDDLCDGGASFIAIAEFLQRIFPDRKRHLFVCHGLFTKGIYHVSQHWDKVITTNSYQDFPTNPNDPLKVPDNFEVINVWSDWQ